MKSVDEILEEIAKACGIELSRLSESSNPDPAVVRARRYAAYVLSKRWKEDDDDGRVQQRLGCSREFVRSAKRLADKDEAFRAEVRQIETSGAETTPAPVPVSDPAPEVSTTVPREEKPESFLFRVAKERYSFGPEALRSRKVSPEVSHARRVLILLGRNVFSMKTPEIEEMLQLSHETITRLVRETSYDFEYDPPFRGEVQEIAKNFGISLARKQMPQSA